MKCIYLHEGHGAAFATNVETACDDLVEKLLVDLSGDLTNENDGENDVNTLQ